MPFKFIEAVKDHNQEQQERAIWQRRMDLSDLVHVVLNRQRWEIAYDHVHRSNKTTVLVVALKISEFGTAVRCSSFNRKKETTLVTKAPIKRKPRKPIGLLYKLVGVGGRSEEKVVGQIGHTPQLLEPTL